MRIIKNNAPVKQEICWNCNSILELNPMDYDTDKKWESASTSYDGNFHSYFKTYFKCPCCGVKNYIAVTIDGQICNPKLFNKN